MHLQPCLSKKFVHNKNITKLYIIELNLQFFSHIFRTLFCLIHILLTILKVIIGIETYLTSFRLYKLKFWLSSFIFNALKYFGPFPKKCFFPSSSFIYITQYLLFFIRVLAKISCFFQLDSGFREKKCFPLEHC